MSEPPTFRDGVLVGIVGTVIVLFTLTTAMVLMFGVSGCVSPPRWPTCEEFRRIDPNDSGLAFMVKDAWDGTVIVTPVEEPGYGRVVGLEWRETPIGMNPCWWEERGFSPAGRREQ